MEIVLLTSLDRVKGSPEGVGLTFVNSTDVLTDD